MRGCKKIDTGKRGRDALGGGQGEKSHRKRGRESDTYIKKVLTEDRKKTNDTETERHTERLMERQRARANNRCRMKGKRGDEEIGEIDTKSREVGEKWWQRIRTRERGTQRKYR